ncbi:MAG: serine/threonine-protein phosphatase [SAR324 cluster bacterium]|nr:serine/threonine-protein phosphatase [SAR324 cluster bacterium]
MSSSEIENVLQAIDTLARWVKKLDSYSEDQIKLNPIPPTIYAEINHLSDTIHDATIQAKKKEEKLQRLSELFEQLEQLKDVDQILNTTFQLLGKYIHFSDSACYLMEDGYYVPEKEAFVDALNLKLNSDVTEYIFSEGDDVRCFNRIEEGSYLHKYFSQVDEDVERANILFLRIHGTGKILCFYQSPGSQGFNHADEEFCKAIMKQAKLRIRNITLIKEEIRLESELKIAGLVQKKLFPKELPRIPNLDIVTFHKSAAETGGDWHGFIQLEDYLYLFIGDVTGHGAPAAIITATVYGAYQVLREKLQNGELVLPHEVLNYLNNVVCASGQGEFLMTFFAGRLNLRTGLMEFSNAGHPFPVYIQAIKPEVKHLYANNPPLGYHENVQFELHSGVLHQNEILILYTDGLIENENKKGYVLTANKLHRFLKQYYADHQNNITSTQLVHEIITRVDGEASIQIEDDLSIICIRQLQPWPEQIV